MGCVEILVVLAVTALNFAIVSRCIGFYELVTDTQLRQDFLKERRFANLLASQTVCELRAVVRLNALNGIWKFLNAMPDKLGGRI